MSFVFGGVSTVILLFFMFVDEDVAHIEHILQIVSILTLLAIVSRCVCLCDLEDFPAFSIEFSLSFAEY